MNLPSRKTVALPTKARRYKATPYPMAYPSKIPCRSLQMPPTGSSRVKIAHVSTLSDNQQAESFEVLQSRWSSKKCRSRANEGKRAANGNERAPVRHPRALRILSQTRAALIQISFVEFCQFNQTIEIVKKDLAISKRHQAHFAQLSKATIDMHGT